MPIGPVRYRDRLRTAAPDEPRNGAGMLSIGKMKPDSRIEGSIDNNIAVSIAEIWVSVTVDTRTPMPRTPHR